MGKVELGEGRYSGSSHREAMDMGVYVSDGYREPYRGYRDFPLSERREPPKEQRVVAFPRGFGGPPSGPMAWDERPVDSVPSDLREGVYWGRNQYGNPREYGHVTY